MEGNLLLAVFVLLAAAVALVPLAKWARLGTVIGYLAAGILIGPYALGLVSDSETIHQIADFGVVIMLFLIGLEVDVDELWRMRGRVVGLGLPQMLATGAALALLLLATGFGWQTATIAGLALAMSSTAIAMQLVTQRAMTRTDTGRTTLAVLLVQDVSVIPVLAAVPLLAALGTDGGVARIGEEVLAVVDNPVDWWLALGILAGFATAIAAGRYVVRPLLRWVAVNQVHEAFTALALALVCGGALLTSAVGLSPALGAFLAGVLLADSEYRHELQSNLEPFKGILLGLFFISVGMAIDFSVLFAEPLRILALVAALVAIKVVVLLLLGRLFGMAPADRLLLAILLSQAGEFAFVVLQFARSAGSIADADAQALTVVVALSMAVTPFLILAYDRLLVPRFVDNDPVAAPPPGPDGSARRVVVLGYGRFGQIVTRLLRTQRLEMTLVDSDPANIELMRRYGVKVFYGDASRLDLLRAAGAAEADLIVIAVAGGDEVLRIAALVRRHFPGARIAARALDRRHAHALMALGVDILERETFHSAVRLGERALIALGHSNEDAARVARAFEAHDQKLLDESYAVRDDEEAYVDIVRSSAAMLETLMEADSTGSSADSKGSSSGRDIDNPRARRDEEPPLRTAPDP